MAGLATAAETLPSKPLHLAIGMFDGVHLGHRAVVEAASQAARGSNGLAMALTFTPHPSRLLRPDQPVRMIQSIEQRVSALLEAGLDGVIVEPFVPEFAAIEASEFLPHIRAALPNLASLYVGENWRYGRGRRGDVSGLISEGRAVGVSVLSAPRINHNGEPISSTRIRECLTQGDVGEANALLGRVYRSSGTVTPGKRLGRQLGVPTLNMEWAPDCLPRFGVYAVRVMAKSASLSGGERGEPAVANFGLRPTVEQSTAPRLEVHVLGDCAWDAGAELEVDWLAFLRPEQRFSSVDELRVAIGADLAAAKRYFAQL